VRDWKLNADFQVTAFGEFTERNAYNEQPATMCGHTPPLHEEVVTGVATFASDPINVTAQLISNPKGNIGDQAFVFSATGTDPSLTDIGQGNGIKMFSMPVSYSTEKTDASPGTGDKPQRFNQKASGGCAAGGGYDSGPKRDPDCGVRTYDSTLNVTMPKARHLYVAGEQSSEFNLWKNCGATLYPYEPPVVPAIQSCDSPTVSGGDVPSIADIFDNGKKHLEVTGALTCSLETNGYLQQLKYSWTLDFCRIEDGKTDC
jgi:hypothetical protein